MKRQEIWIIEVQATMFPNFPLFRHRRKPFEVTYTEGRSIDKVDAITNYHLDVLRKKNNWFVKYTILDAR